MYGKASACNEKDSLLCRAGTKDGGVRTSKSIDLGSGKDTRNMRLQQALDSVKPTNGPCDRETKMEDRGTPEGHGRKRPKVINEHLQSGARIGADRKSGLRRDTGGNVRR